MSGQRLSGGITTLCQRLPAGWEWRSKAPNQMDATRPALLGPGVSQAGPVWVKNEEAA